MTKIKHALSGPTLRTFMYLIRKCRLDQLDLILEKFCVGNRIDHLPAELSGGEQQRVAIARALVNSPQVIFADEPTGNLDSRNGAQVMEMLLALSAEDGATLVVVTHDEALAENGDRKLVIKDGMISEDAVIA